MGEGGFELSLNWCCPVLSGVVRCCPVLSDTVSYHLIWSFAIRHAEQCWTKPIDFYPSGRRSGRRYRASGSALQPREELNLERMSPDNISTDVTLHVRLGSWPAIWDRRVPAVTAWRGLMWH